MFREIAVQVVLFRFYYSLLKLTVLRKFDATLQRKLAVRYVSATHAFCSGTFALLSFFLYPDLIMNPSNSFNDFDYHLILFSVSYFCHDIVDMIIHGEGVKYIEYIMHHVFMLSCFTAVLRVPQVLPIAVFGLVAEVNTVFIHLRLILKFYGFGAESKFYRFNQLLNIVSFIPTRQLNAIWIIWFSLTEPSEHVTPLIRATFIAGCLFITVHNYRIFSRLLIVEGYFKPKTMPPSAPARVMSDDLINMFDETPPDNVRDTGHKDDGKKFY